MAQIIQFIEVVLFHPNHPRLIHFPIALSYLGVLAVLLVLLRRDAFFDRAAFYIMLLLAVSILPAGVTGILENQTYYAGNAPNASLKVTLAGLLLLLLCG